MEQKPETNIAVVIVLYQPRAEEVENVRRLSSCYHGAVVDNSAVPTFPDGRLNLMDYVFMGQNAGIAKAQNVGVRTCLKDGQTQYVVFLDQDSKVDTDYPKRIVDEYERLSVSFPRLGILGPTAVDQASHDAYASKIHREQYLSDDLYVRAKIISSGSCIPRRVLDDVGLNDERLFIDFVDSEWCWRAGSKGYLCGMSPRVTLTHHIGRRVVSLWLFRDVLSAPYRYFYRMRNYLWLARRSYVPKQWKVNEGAKFVLRFFYLPFTEEGLSSWKSLCRGFREGMKGSGDGSGATGRQR